MESTGRAWITSELDEDGEEVLVLNFCKQFIEDLGWKAGDELSWTMSDDGSSWFIDRVDYLDRG
jgi:hypothetical protein